MIRFDTPYGTSKCHTCGREFDAVTSPPDDPGAPDHCWRELGSAYAAALERIKELEGLAGRNTVTIARLNQMLAQYGAKS